MELNWIKCESGHMPEDDERYKGKKIINVLVTTKSGTVTKVQRMYDTYYGSPHWSWGRIYGGCIAWMPLPHRYEEK